jgi:hypothetical protein
MNKLDQLIERKSFELFTSMELHPDLVQFKIKELQICVERGYNSRAEILGLIKKAVA